ncbi:hypothetical protein [uncultured Microbulbifer sp.]|nr:hypothetical protein [uncultured Microbulbifer sp.]
MKQVDKVGHGSAGLGRQWIFTPYGATNWSRALEALFSVAAW